MAGRSTADPADVPRRKMVVAVEALSNLLRSNAPAVVDLFMDQCYSANAAVAHAYFQVRLPVAVNSQCRCHHDPGQHL